jgi:hypothetical protein
MKSCDLFAVECRNFCLPRALPHNMACLTRPTSRSSGMHELEAQRQTCHITGAYEMQIKKVIIYANYLLNNETSLWYHVRVSLLAFSISSQYKTFWERLRSFPFAKFFHLPEWISNSNELLHLLVCLSCTKAIWWLLDMSSNFRTVDMFEIINMQRERHGWVVINCASCSGVCVFVQWLRDHMYWLRYRDFLE